MRSFTTSLCLLASAAVFSAPALAASASASASIDQFTFELIDLDLADNITPAITFGDQTWYSNVRYAGYPYENSEIATAGTTEVLRNFGAGRGATSATSVSASSNLVNPSSSYASEHSFTGQSIYAVDFTLTPGTGLRMTAIGSIAVDRNGLDTLASASLVLDSQLSEWDAPWSEAQNSSQHISTGEPGSGTFNLSAYLFTEDVARSGRFGISTTASTYIDTIPGPIPEPSTYAMLLAGAAIVAVKRGRRRRAV